ncbi:sensor histidine kinase [Alteromonas gracilis]|uniref:Sensor histidine kinase n=1 Tax=Alteromonas gracilis TaxID=1479524 RepID=A0ABX5CKP4_9ALTE|nr:ATP-binding protein [Alteromonas gracilis]PRO67978.1 sensor histidine kinase [Alteromonas gracilis]
MSGFTKISTAIVAVFIGCFLMFSYLVYFHIQDNIEEEMTGALNQVREMVNLNIPVADIEAIVEPSPHLSAHYFTGRLQAEQPSAMSTTERNALAPVIIPIQENQYLIVTPFDTTELTQNLTFFALVAGLFFATFVLLLFTLNVAVKQRLVPLNQLAEALSELREGKDSQPLPHSDITEMNRVIDQFKHLQNALKSKEKQLIKIDKQLALLQEQERNYLARELHDNVGQLLTTIKAHAYILVNAKERAVVELSAQKVQVMSHQISDAIRKLTAHLHPLILDKVPLQSSLERLVYEQEIAQPDTQWDVSINLKRYEEDRERDIHLYRFAQEAINNVIKHAKATKVSIQIYGDTHCVSIEVKDNGRGLGNHIVENIGMSSMRSRARCIGASCSVVSTTGGGVTVSLQLPLTQPSPELGINAA